MLARCKDCAALTDVDPIVLSAAPLGARCRVSVTDTVDRVPTVIVSESDG